MTNKLTIPDTDNPPSAGVEDYKLAMRRVVSPVAVVTSANGSRQNGLTAITICSAATEPPTMVVSINRAEDTLQLINQSKSFAVNFLSEEQSDIARAFSAREIGEENHLQIGSWTSLTTGAPVLRDAVSSFDCVLEHSIPYGTHQLLLGRTVAVVSQEVSALLYRDGFFRRITSE